MLKEFLFLFTPLQEQGDHALAEADAAIANLGLRRGNDIHAAVLNVSLTKEKVIETFIQCIPYIGFPRVPNALNVAKQIFAR